MPKKSPKNPEIIYEDEHMIAVNKPAGLLSIPDRYLDLPNCLTALRKNYDQIYAVHRLDRETSGILLFARSEQAHKALNDQFESRKIEKTYYAYIDGIPLKPQGTIDARIAKSKSKAGRMETVPKLGKVAISHYELVDTYGQFAKLSVNIETGRTHQIRVHLKSIGHPLLVDKLYGMREALYLSEIKRRKYRISKFEEERAFISRQTLHAAKIGFLHPATGQKTQLEADLPKDLKALEKQLSKWSK